MTTANEFDMTVLGGLKVTVDYDYDYCTETGASYNWYIVAINGRRVKPAKCNWLYKRIKDEGYDDVIADACREHASEW